MNRYFIFKKVITKDAAKQTRLLLSSTDELDFAQNAEMGDLEEEIKRQQKVMPAVRGQIKKLKVRVKLQKMPSDLFSLPTESALDLESPEENKKKVEDTVAAEEEELEVVEAAEEPEVVEVKKPEKKTPKKKKEPSEAKKKVQEMLNKMKK